MRRYVFDLFAGPGGWSHALAVLGVRDVGLEWDEWACKTRVRAGQLTIRTDVAMYPVWPMVGRTDGFIASPPCQAWSMAGKRLGLVDQPLVHQAVADLAVGRDTREQLLATCKDPGPCWPRSRCAISTPCTRWANRSGSPWKRSRTSCRCGGSTP